MCEIRYFQAFKREQSIEMRICLPRIESTNDYLKELSQNQELDDFGLVWTKDQTKGRGQRNKRWFGENGKNLYCSFFLKPHFIEPEQQFQLVTLASLAIRETLQRFLTDPVRIKWPNDIFIGQKKITGILIENSIQAGRIEESIIGFGVNINQIDFPEEGITSLQLELQQEINIEDVLALLIQNLKSLFSSLKESRDLSEEYLKYLIGYKQGIQIMHEGQLLEGEISSLRDDGCIAFTTEQGISTFCSGEINFLRSSF